MCTRLSSIPESASDQMSKVSFRNECCATKILPTIRRAAAPRVCIGELCCHGISYPSFEVLFCFHGRSHQSPSRQRFSCSSATSVDWRGSRGKQRYTHASLHRRASPQSILPESTRLFHINDPRSSDHGDNDAGYNKDSLTKQGGETLTLPQG